MVNQVSTQGSMLTWNSTLQTGLPMVSGRRQLKSVLAGLTALSGIPGITQKQLRAQNEIPKTLDLTEGVECVSQRQTPQTVDVCALSLQVQRLTGACMLLSSLLFISVSQTYIHSYCDAITNLCTYRKNSLKHMQNVPWIPLSILFLLSLWISGNIDNINIPERD